MLNFKSVLLLFFFCSSLSVMAIELPANLLSCENIHHISHEKNVVVRYKKEKSLSQKVSLLFGRLFNNKSNHKELDDFVYLSAHNWAAQDWSKLKQACMKSGFLLEFKESVQPNLQLVLLTIKGVV